MSEYFREPKSSGGRVKVELDSSNYTTKADLKNATGADASKFAKKVDLSNLKSNVDKFDINKLKNAPTNLSHLKSKVDKLDVDKLVPDPVHLSKLSDALKNDVVKKDAYNAKGRRPYPICQAKGRLDVSLKTHPPTPQNVERGNTK